MNRKIDKAMLWMLGMAGGLWMLGMAGGRVYAACYFYYGAYRCSANYTNMVVYSDPPPPAGVPFQCKPGLWDAVSASPCYNASGQLVGELKFTSCVARSSGGSLWLGCTPDSAPTPTPGESCDDANVCAPVLSCPISRWRQGQCETGEVCCAPGSEPTPTPASTPTPTTPTSTPTPTPTPARGAEPKAVVVEACGGPLACGTNGDYNGDGKVDILDYEEWKIDYAAGDAALACFEYWRRATFEFGRSKATRTINATGRTDSGTVGKLVSGRVSFPEPGVFGARPKK